MEAGVSLNCFCALGTHFFLLSCFFQQRCEGFFLVILLFVSSCLVVVSWTFALFRTEMEEEWMQERREVCGVTRRTVAGKTLVRIYCMKEDSIFNKKEIAIQ